MSERQVRFGRRFTHDFIRLRKHYRHISDDVDPLIEQLKRGETPGEQVQRIGYPVYKVRLRNQDAGRGKSGGYRVLYYVQTNELIILAAIYSKSERSDIPADEIRQIIQDILNTKR